MLAEREGNFQQRVISATLLQDPELKAARAIFSPETDSLQTNSDGEAIFYPTTAEDFEKMAEMFEFQ